MSRRDPFGMTAGERAARARVRADSPPAPNVEPSIGRGVWAALLEHAAERRRALTETPRMRSPLLEASGDVETAGAYRRGGLSGLP